MEILDEATELLQPVYTDILTLSPLQEVMLFLLVMTSVTYWIC